MHWQVASGKNVPLPMGRDARTLRHETRYIPHRQAFHSLTTGHPANLQLQFHRCQPRVAKIERTAFAPGIDLKFASTTSTKRYVRSNSERQYGRGLTLTFEIEGVTY